MQTKSLFQRVLSIPALFAAAACMVVGASSAWGQGYKRIDLASNVPGAARYTDGNLRNAWGLVASPSGRLIVANNGAGVGSFYAASGRPLSLVITIPAPEADATSTPTDVALNFSWDFRISHNGRTRPSLLLFVTEDGTIAGWHPDLDRTNAFIVVDNSGSEAVYKGVALGHTWAGRFLYAANFKAGIVEMYDRNFRLVKTFTDTNLPAGFAPFGIRNIFGRLVVTFAKQAPPENDDDLPGPGLGYVDVFSTSGRLLFRFASEGPLNAPWGLAVAPWNFGRFSNTLLVGNFGDGRINAYSLRTGAFLGQLKDKNGQPIEIDGLWGLAVGYGSYSLNDYSGTRSVYFTAGPNDENDGLLGVLQPNSSWWP
jgi:uncharacterized protein (TIGR03118 family)